jgi:hypothetical protein
MNRRSKEETIRQRHLEQLGGQQYAKKRSVSNIKPFKRADETAPT